MCLVKEETCAYSVGDHFENITCIVFHSVLQFLVLLLLLGFLLSLWQMLMLPLALWFALLQLLMLPLVFLLAALEFSVSVAGFDAAIVSCSVASFPETSNMVINRGKVTKFLRKM